MYDSKCAHIYIINFKLYKHIYVTTYDKSGEMTNARICNSALLS
jgi:hypothetical protein